MPGRSDGTISGQSIPPAAAMSPGSLRRPQLLWLSLVLAAGFALRVGLRLPLGESEVLEGGYHFYLTMAQSFLQGQGLCFADHDCARRMPGYPLIIAPLAALGWVYPGVAILQSLAGAFLAWVVWRIARELFDDTAGLLAATLAALSPYAILHDTAIQETVWINLFVALGVLLLLIGKRNRALLPLVGAGTVLAIGVLITARVALFLPCAILWVLVGKNHGDLGRWRRTALVTAPIVLLVGGWMLRNWSVVGKPVMTTESGESLWAGNSSATFAYFPAESIDLSVREGYRRLTATQTRMLTDLADNNVARDRLLASWAVEYIKTHPLETFGSSMRKVWVALAAEYSPHRTRLVNLGYRAIFLPLHVLAALGVFWYRKQWPTHSLVYGLILSFLVTTAVFWAHSSHKSLIDAFVFVFAAAATQKLWMSAATWIRR